MSIKVDTFETVQEYKRIVVLVDDNRDQLTLLKFLLTTYNNKFEYATFNLVDEAIKFIKKTVYTNGNAIIELIISDFYMYPKNGLDFLKIVKEMNLPIPFVLYSAFLSSGIIQEAKRLGAEKCIRKDLELKKIIYEIGNYIVI